MRGSHSFCDQDKTLGRHSPVLWQRESLKDTRAEHENCETCCLGTLHSDDLKKSSKLSSICKKNGKDSRRDISCDVDDVDVVAGNDFAACRVCEFPGSWWEELRKCARPSFWPPTPTPTCSDNTTFVKCAPTQNAQNTIPVHNTRQPTNTNRLRQHYTCQMCTDNKCKKQNTS